MVANGTQVVVVKAVEVEVDVDKVMVNGGKKNGYSGA